jgi:hypothetical protein
LGIYQASISDLNTLLFSLLQNSEGGGNGNSWDSCVDPPNFSEGEKYHLQPLSFTFETFGKNLQKQKSLQGSV